MRAVQSDLVQWYKLETEFFQDRVGHGRYAEKGKNRYKRRLPPNIDCSRELLVIAILAKVSIVPERLCPGLIPVWDFLVKV